MDLCSVLAHDDFTGLYQLATKSFDAKALCIGVTTVAG